MLFAGLPALLACGLIAFQPASTRAQDEGSPYTVIYQGSADFSYKTVSGQYAGTEFIWHVDWSAKADGANLTRDAGLVYSTSTSRFPEAPVGPMDFTVLTGTLSVTQIGQPGGDKKCTGALLHLPGTMMTYSMSMGPYDGADGSLAVQPGEMPLSYAVAVQPGDMPLSFKYMQTSNIVYVDPKDPKTQYANPTTGGCLATPDPNGFQISTFPGVPSGKPADFQSVRVPLVDIYPIDPAQQFDESRSQDFNYTGPTDDPNGPGATTYVGKIHSTVEVRTYGPLVIST